MQENQTQMAAVAEAAEFKPLRHAVGVVDNDRALARIVKIDSIHKHSNADALELVIVGGWQCVTKIGEYKVGETAVYCEIDSLLPIDRPEFAFLAARRSDNFLVDGKECHRLKSIKLRKELSQGLLVKTPEAFADKPVDTNVTADLGILKYEGGASEKDAEEAAKGLSFFDRLVFNLTKDLPFPLTPWPSGLMKSTQDRVQNKTNPLNAAIAAGEVFEASVKLNGSSATVFTLPGVGEIRTGVCSRNNEITTVDIPVPFAVSVKYWLGTLLARNRRFFKTWTLRSPIWKTVVGGGEDQFTAYVLKNGVIDKLKAYQAKTGRYITVQGELIGPGIQENFEGVENHELHIYNVYENGSMELRPEEAKAIVKELGLTYVPVLDGKFVIPLDWTSKDLLKMADGPRAFNHKKGLYREGLVLKSLTRPFSFKVISDSFLLKSTD